MSNFGRFIILVSLLFTAEGCVKNIPQERYGIHRLKIEGVERFDPSSIASCLATTERTRTPLIFDSTPACGKPPFDQKFRPRFWSWWFTEWPTYDPAVLKRDAQRIERWYAARGHYDAAVIDIQFSPSINDSNARIRGDVGKRCAEKSDGACPIEVTMKIDEGLPSMVTSKTLSGTSDLDDDLRQELRETWTLNKGERFDEYDYETTKAKLLKSLHDATYACASVTGRVDVDKKARSVAVHFHVDAGPRSKIGKVDITGNEDLSEGAIRGAAYLEKGDPYRESELIDAQHAVYALGAFASVDVTSTARKNEQEQCIGIVDVEIAVTPGKLFRYGIGAGFESGNVGQAQNVPQWDLHLLLFAEHRNFLGGLRRLKLEWSPKLVFLAPFPGVSSAARNDLPPTFGSDLVLDFTQPGFIEDRTTLAFNAGWSVGPDPVKSFARHEVDSRISLKRNFFNGRLGASIGFHLNIQEVIDRAVGEPSSDHHVTFTEAELSLDLRNDSRNPTSGFYTSLAMDQAGVWLPSSWDYFRMRAETRGYVPLPLDWVFALRASLSAMWITNINSSHLDAVSVDLGPQRYRLRAGGSTSHRGYVAGFMDDPINVLTNDGSEKFQSNDGGLRRWELSLELRIPLSDTFGIVTFADMGDVSRLSEGGTFGGFRLNYIRLAIGGGIRYNTIVGPLRIDVGWLVPRAQAFGVDKNTADFLERARLEEFQAFGLFNGAIHVTFGEAF